MENDLHISAQLIADSYGAYHEQIFFYINKRINSREDSEDLSQDVFVRLMDYEQLLCPETVKSFIYTIARNLVTDYLRHYYKRQEVTSYIYDNTPAATTDAESAIVARDLQVQELKCLRALPEQRRKIYMLNRFQDRSSSEIADTLQLSRRTVENHLFICRKEVRAYMKQCI